MEKTKKIMKSLYSVVSLTLVMGLVTSCGDSKKSGKENETDFEVEIYELGTLGDDTDYPLSMSLDSAGTFRLKMDDSSDVYWTWEGTDKLTVQSVITDGDEKKEESEDISGDEIVSETIETTGEESTEYDKDTVESKNMTCVYSIAYGVESQEEGTDDTISQETGSVLNQTDLTDEDISFAMFSKEAGIRYSFKVEVKQGIITKLIDSSFEKIDVSFEDIPYYDEISDTLNGVKIPVGAKIISYDLLEMDDSDGTQEENQDGEAGIKRVLISVDDLVYKLAATAKDDAYGVLQMKQQCEANISGQGKNLAEYSQVINVGNTEVTMYRFGEVSAAVYVLNEKNCLLFIDDESTDFKAIEDAAKLFINI